MKKKINLSKVVLLSPYTGTNLGDTALLDAMIQNLKSRSQKSEIYGITLDPSDTYRRHKIKSFPITSFTLPYYSISSNNGDDSNNKEEITNKY